MFGELRKLLLPGVLLLAFYFVKCYLNRGLHKVPGPFLRSICPAIRVWSAWTGKSHLHDLKLHQRYGKIVRIAPNMLSISDVDEIGRIYGATSKYFVSKTLDPLRVYDEEGLFPDISVMTDKAMHTRVKKGAAHAYSMSAFVKQEPMLDVKIQRLLDFLDEFAASGQKCDVSMNMRCFTLDLILHLTLGKDFDLLKQESGRWMFQPMDAGLAYATIVGQVPTLHWMLEGNKYYQRLFRKKDFITEAIMKWAQEEISSAIKPDMETDTPQTLLQQLMAKQSQDPSVITDREMLADVYLNIAAGFDTTATTICATLIRLLDHPRVYEKAISEVRAHASTPVVSYAKAGNMRYLNAVIRETMRIYPPVQLMLPREVPAGGDEICGIYVPAGVEVGINPYISQRDPDIFDQPQEFLPERWMINDEEQLKRMNRAFLVFSSGQHACSGKHVANMSILKSVASVLLRYDMQYADGTHVECVNYFVALHKGLNMTFRRSECN